MNTGGRLARRPLKGRIGDAVLCACGHNIRKILARMRVRWCLLLHLTKASIWRERHYQSFALAV